MCAEGLRSLPEDLLGALGFQNDAFCRYESLERLTREAVQFALLSSGFVGPVRVGFPLFVPDLILVPLGALGFWNDGFIIVLKA